MAPESAFRHRISRAALLFLVVTAGIAFDIPQVKAATVNIENLTYPKRIVVGKQESITLQATVSFSGVPPGLDWSHFPPTAAALVVMLLDGESRQVLRGSAETSPPHQGCIPEKTAILCGLGLWPGYGSYVIVFTFPVRPALGTWSLIIDATIHPSVQDIFTVSAHDSMQVSTKIVDTDLVSLEVRVPGQVVVTIDGIPQPAGPVQVRILMGEHKISVPVGVDVTADSKLRFDNWSDGTFDPNRTVIFLDDASLEAKYVTQYRLLIMTRVGRTEGSGWYDAGSLAVFSVQRTSEQMDGTLGLLGGFWRFRGWNENGTLMTYSSQSSVTMDHPHRVEALWEPDYTRPTLAIGLILMAALAILLFRRRSTRSQAGRFPERDTGIQARYKQYF